MMRAMKKSIGDNMIPKAWGFERGLELVKQAGFDGIELWLGDAPWFQMSTSDADIRWSRGQNRVPYVDFIWPHPAKIRDFSRVVPLGSHPGETIAWADGLRVAFKQRIERGTLIYLGSPLGPALWAGDVAARRWLLNLSAPFPFSHQ